ncbi:unnamed protein product [Meloidogyne enterolobii]|uniref:Uncharacterized protein n=1 Tax=Meloidogyne enterolobii TaxID=390850 RepID=A0ACB0ZTC3_MELEN
MNRSNRVIDNIPYNTPYGDIYKLCATYGVIKALCVKFDRNKIRPGRGFCEFQAKQEAENAISGINGIEMKGHTLCAGWDKYQK